MFFVDHASGHECRDGGHVTVRTEAREAAPEDTRSFRSLPWVAVGVVLMLAIIGLITGYRFYAVNYMPLGIGGDGGPLTKSLKVESVGGTQVQYLLVGPPGTVGSETIELLNDGNHSVRLLGIDGEGGITKDKLTWLPTDRMEMTILTATQRQFPTTLAPHHAVGIVFSQTQPNCVQQGGPGRTTFGFGIRWSALGVNHVYDVPQGYGSDPLPMAECYTAADVARLRLQIQ